MDTLKSGDVIIADFPGVTRIKKRITPDEVIARR